MNFGCMILPVILALLKWQQERSENLLWLTSVIVWMVESLDLKRQLNALFFSYHACCDTLCERVVTICLLYLWSFVLWCCFVRLITPMWCVIRYFGQTKSVMVFSEVAYRYCPCSYFFCFYFPIFYRNSHWIKVRRSNIQGQQILAVVWLLCWKWA